MKTSTLSKEKRAFSLIELLVLIGIVAFLIFLLLPAVGHQSAGQKTRWHCGSNLKQVWLAFRLWQDDHDGRYPMQTCTNELGAPLFTNSATAFRIFQVMSNELSDPRILYCPADTQRRAGTNFSSDFRGSSISYFIGLQADANLPSSFLVGDSNITNGMSPKDGILELTTNQTVGWTKERHNSTGNVSWAGGGVQQFTSISLQHALKDTGLATNRLLFP